MIQSQEQPVLYASLKQTVRKRGNSRFLNAGRISASFSFKQYQSLPRGMCLTATDSS